MLLIHYLDQGLSKTAIARRLGLDRRTIHRWISSGRLEVDVETRLLPALAPRAVSPSKLEPYKEIITTA